MDPNLLAFQGLYMVCLLMSLSIHEASHAAVATLCGDDTPRNQGRLTLNPVAHLDPLGSLLLPVILILSGAPFVFGWARPVVTNPDRFGDSRLDPVKVAMAGPASNLLLVVLILGVAKVVFFFSGGPNLAPTLVFNLLYEGIRLNCILAVFNMLPFPPLDGHYLLNMMLPEKGQEMMKRLAPFGFILAIVVGLPLILWLLPRLRVLIANSFGL